MPAGELLPLLRPLVAAVDLVARYWRRGEIPKPDQTRMMPLHQALSYIAEESRWALGRKARRDPATYLVAAQRLQSACATEQIQLYGVNSKTREREAVAAAWWINRGRIDLERLLAGESIGSNDERGIGYSRLEVSRAQVEHLWPRPGRLLRWLRSRRAA